MKKLSILAALMATIVGVYAAGIDGVSRRQEGVSTTATPTVVTNGPFYGKLLSINAVSTDNMNVRYRTVAGRGATLGNSRVLLNTNALTSAGINSNISETVYLYGDYIVTELSSAATNVAVYEGLILVAPAP